MTYTGDSLIVSQGEISVTADVIDAFFAVEGRKLAPGYAPDKTYAPPPAGLGAAVIAAANRWAYTANHVQVAAQSCIESAGWQSYWARRHNNPAGIGVTGQVGIGEHFDTMREGFDAQVAHLLNYAAGRGGWTTTDPRATAMPPSYYGAAPTLDGLSGKWAVPGVGYGINIAAMANRLVDFAKEQPTMAGDDARFTWNPDPAEFGYPAGRHGRNGLNVDYLIIHVTEGTDSSAWLRGAHGSSTHYLTWHDATPREQHVREADAAWTPGNGDYALRSINIEFERFAKDPWTDAELANAVATCKPIIARHRIPAVYLGRDNVGKRGIIGHQDVPDPNDPGQWGGSSNHTDPGSKFPWTRFITGLNASAGGPPPPPIGGDPITGKFIHDNFRPYFVANGGVSVFGRPVSGAFLEDARLTQYFERSVYQWFPENADPYKVQLRLLGTEELQRRYPTGAPA